MNHQGKEMLFLPSYIKIIGKNRHGTKEEKNTRSQSRVYWKMTALKIPQNLKGKTFNGVHRKTSTPKQLFSLDLCKIFTLVFLQNLHNIAANIYLFKVNNKNTRKRRETVTKLEINKPEQHKNLVKNLVPLYLNLNSFGVYLPLNCNT